jgi:hypothetical protein
MPVLSMAAWVHPSDTNQSRQAKRSQVIVEKVFTIVRGFSSGLPTARQTTIFFLWTSMPQHLSMMASILKYLLSVIKGADNK